MRSRAERPLVGHHPVARPPPQDAAVVRDGDVRNDPKLHVFRPVQLDADEAGDGFVLSSRAGKAPHL